MVDEKTTDADDTADDVVDESTDADDTAGTDGDAETLGDAGKKALDAMKAKWKAERDRRADLQRQIDESAKPKDDADKPDLDAVRKQAREEARMETLRERVLDKIEAKAAKGFKDPEDALLRLGRNVDDYIDDGKIDLQQIEDDLSDLLKKRPDFSVTQGETKRFKGSADGGPKGNAGNPQLSEADVKRLYAEKRYDEIQEARNAGRLKDYMGT